MQSPRSRQRLRGASSASPAGQFLSAFLVVALALIAGCASGGAGAPPVPEQIRLPDLSGPAKEYLTHPLEGYDLVVPPQAAERLAEGHRQMLTAGDAAGAERAEALAAELLATDPGLHPAVVLEAQAELALGRYRQAFERVRPVAEERPGYLAAQLLLGRAAEKLGEVVEAYAAFRAAADASTLAAERSGELEERVLEIVASRLREGLRRGRLDEAARALERLESWAPGSLPALEAAAEVARARGDAELELTAVRELARRDPDDPALRERWAELELDAGDPSIGLEIFQRLVIERPADAALKEKLGYAKFRWRLTLLPERVQEDARRAELERGDWAVMLYWLLPSVRYGQVERPRIAADILDDPRREEIARVVNLGLMEVNEVLHRFFPLEPVTRAAVLRSLLGVLGRSEQPIACVEGLPRSPSQELVCATAARCALLVRQDDCLPEGSVSGREGLVFLRRTLELIGAR